MPVGTSRGHHGDLDVVDVRIEFLELLLHPWTPASTSWSIRCRCGPLAESLCLSPRLAVRGAAARIDGGRRACRYDRTRLSRESEPSCFTSLLYTPSMRNVGAHCPTKTLACLFPSSWSVADVAIDAIA